MLNRIQFEGIVMNLWRYGGTHFARLVHRPDPGQNERDILMTVRFNQHTPLDIRKGDLLRVWGFLDNRPMDDNGSNGDSYVAEIVTDGIVTLARDQLPGQKTASRRSSKATVDTGGSNSSDGTAVAAPEGETDKV